MLEGLDRVDALKPGSGFAQAIAGVSLAGAFARGELGWHPTANASLFGFGEAEALWGGPVTASAGVGARVSW